MAIVTGVGVALVSTWLWMVYQKPKLTIEVGMGTQNWAEEIQADSAFLTATLIDAYTGNIAVRLRSRTARAFVAPYRGEHEILIKVLVHNSGRTAATNLRMPIYIGFPGEPWIEYSPHVEAELQRESSATAGIRVDAVKLTSLPPHTPAIITYHFPLADSIWEITGKNSVDVRLRPPSADEISPRSVQVSQVPLGLIASKENHIGIVGSPVLIQRVPRSGAPGSVIACVDSADIWYRQILTLCGGRRPTVIDH
jgi:hypothetical protein